MNKDKKNDPFKALLLSTTLSFHICYWKVHGTWIFSKYVKKMTCGKALPFNTTQGQPNDNFKNVCWKELVC
jgi:hypothetical protein